MMDFIYKILLKIIYMLVGLFFILFPVINLFFGMAIGKDIEDGIIEQDIKRKIFGLVCILTFIIEFIIFIFLIK